MDGPVGSSRLAELAGAVERVDDPYPVGGQPCLVVEAFLGKDGVGGAFPGQLGHQELVGLAVTSVSQGTGIAALGTQVEKEAAGALR